MQSKFSRRSEEEELLDAPDIPKDLLFQNLRELDTVNRLLGGHAITLAGMRALITDKNKEYHIADIGCGGGDAMREIARWARRNGYRVKLTGVDMNADCIAFMQEACREFPEISGVNADYRDYLRSVEHTDIVHCSLFCHHLDDEQLVELFSYLDRFSRTGFVINDLQRHWFAYYSIKFLTRALNGSVLVKNDAPLSVLRSFRKEELQALLSSAGVRNCSISWKWAFRYLVLCKKSAA